MDTTQLNKQLQEWIDEMEKKGLQVSLNDINAHLQTIMTTHNATPVASFNGFTPNQMSQMLSSPLGEHCPVKLRQLSDEQIQQIPIMRQVLHLMDILCKGDLKLTNQGYIPPKIVSELYDLGIHSWSSDYYNHLTEARSEEVQTLRVVLKQCGLIKTLLGKMSLTAKGKKLLPDHNKLMSTVIVFLMDDYNTAWLDAYEDYRTGNIGRCYSLWLLHHFGSDWRHEAFYESEYAKAFPRLDATQGYWCRVFQRLFRLIGICEINDGKEFAGQEWSRRARKTPLLEMMFSFEEPDNQKA